VQTNKQIRDVLPQEDDFEVQLDEADAPSGPPAAAPPAGAFRYTRPGAPQQPQARPEAPRPYMDAAASAAQPVGPWAGGGGRGGPGGGRGMGTRPWRPQFIPLSETRRAVKLMRHCTLPTH